VPAPDPSALARDTLAGDRRALARLMTVVENRSEAARPALAALFPHTGRAHIIGVTGAPGAGKSSLINELAKAYRRRGLRVGILAVDPTSPFSGGAILGDRVRMQELAGDAGVFIRSMASRGSVGGIAETTGDLVKLLDAAGFERVFVETVGAGQAEVDIARTAHTTVVLEVPGMGDDIQVIKAGIVEIADIFVVNKADREGADAVAGLLESMLDLNTGEARRVLQESCLADMVCPPDSYGPDGWRPPVCQTVTSTAQGVGAVVEALEMHWEYLDRSGRRVARERLRAATEVEGILRQELVRRVVARAALADMSALVDRVARRQMDPYSAAEALLARLS
jgi:LAO/AO transport system kinase